MKSIFHLFAGLLAMWGGSAFAADLTAAAASRQFVGRFDNQEQVAKAPGGGGSEQALPRVTVTIEATPHSDFTLWHVHLETDPQTSFDQTWAMQARIGAGGSGELIPYYQLKQDAPPAAAAFDPQGWLSLEACALRGSFSSSAIDAIAEGEPCVAVSMSVGARRALLPVGLRQKADELQLDFNLRGVRTRIDARRAR